MVFVRSQGMEITGACTTVCVRGIARGNSNNLGRYLRSRARVDASNQPISRNKRAFDNFASMAP